MEPIKVWQCIGCGRVEGPAQCIGVCQDRIAELVDVSELRKAEAQLERMRALLAWVVHTTPRNGEWERTYRAFQDKAKEIMGSDCI
ncbi:MAG TPA: hypothetical protein VFP36_03275 [Usitatibacter sp.]|nr:hypothetical protein [Usitatibacter sp.]